MNNKDDPADINYLPACLLIMAETLTCVGPG